MMRIMKEREREDVWGGQSGKLGRCMHEKAAVVIVVGCNWFNK